MDGQRPDETRISAARITCYWTDPDYVTVLGTASENGGMPTRAQWLRLKAEECRVIGEMLRDEEARAQLMLLAEQYERLAVTFEKHWPLASMPASPTD